MYVYDAEAIIIVYDMTFQESLEGAALWYKQVTEQSSVTNCVVALVGNKCDYTNMIQVSNRSA